MKEPIMNERNIVSTAAQNAMPSGVRRMFELAKKYPEEIDRLYAILEDEALNSGLPPAVLSAYLKKRLGYDKDTPKNDGAEGQMTIRFEHDIFSDGE